MPKMIGGIKTGRVYAKLPAEDTAEIEAYIEESGVYRACFLSYALVVGMRAMDRQRAGMELAQLRTENLAVDARPEYYSSSAYHERAVARQELVKKVIEQMAPEQRQLLELSYFEGLSQSEIAARLGQPLGTVQARMQMGLQHFKVLLVEYGLIGGQN